MSERVTWDTCPSCGHSAAVGWIDGNPVEFDCLGGCSLSAGQLMAAFGPGRRDPDPG
ncbi:MAG: uncharacterized protein JWQ26_3319 [Modestobacter sp.]|nr:uncharacterized protein [Modestobacter sp.]